MNINSLSSTSASFARPSSSVERKKTEPAAKNTPAESGVVYEKSSGKMTENNSSAMVNKTTYKKENSAIIAQMKADTEARTAQMQNLAKQMMAQQGQAIGNADSIWRFLAKGNFTVDAATKAQAQADIAEDGYWGVEQTSSRIVDFAKALAGNDPAKADTFLKAFEKGFNAATKSWGQKLPDISQRTYDAVIKKFDQWKTEGASSQQ